MFRIYDCWSWCVCMCTIPVNKQEALVGRRVAHDKDVHMLPNAANQSKYCNGWHIINTFASEASCVVAPHTPFNQRIAQSKNNTSRVPIHTRDTSDPKSNIKCGMWV